MPGALDVTRLRDTLCGPGGGWSEVRVVERTGSTNADLLAGADATPDRTVLAAEHQDAGRGRRTRVWEARPAEGLTVSALLRPLEVPPARRGAAPLLAGLALVTALGRAAPGVEAALKWPNDLLLGPGLRKGAGVLVEADGAGADAALVVGVGLNVATPVDQLPDGATSLVAELPTDAPAPDRTAVLVALLTALAEVDDRWRAAGGDLDGSGLLDRYRSRCATLGRPVRVLLAGDRSLEGTATDVDASGRLLVRDRTGDTTVVSAGDVVHLRPAGR